MNTTAVVGFGVGAKVDIDEIDPSKIPRNTKVVFNAKSINKMERAVLHNTRFLNTTVTLIVDDPKQDMNPELWALVDNVVCTRECVKLVNERGLHATTMESMTEVLQFMGSLGQNDSLQFFPKIQIMGSGNWGEMAETETELCHRVGTFGLVKNHTPGTHVIVPFRGGNGEECFWHHGIYLGEINGEEKVIHMVPGENTVEVDLYQFAAANPRALRVVKYPGDETDCIERARAKQSEGIQYNEETFNCEHFATYCKTGRADTCRDFLLPPPTWVNKTLSHKPQPARIVPIV